MKAWRCTVDWSDDQTGEIIHAKTASKARYMLLLRLCDCCEIRFADITVKRAADRDIHLPPEHDLVPQLSDEERRRILHAYGYSNEPRRPEAWGYRDHYCTTPQCTIMAHMTYLGIFRGPLGLDKTGDTPRWVGAFWYLTDLGKQVARSMIPAYGSGE